MQHDKTVWNRMFDVINYTILALVAVLTVLPFIYVIVSSFSTAPGIIPKDFSFAAYRYIFSTHTFLRSLYISIYITILGTCISLLFTSLMAYSLSYKHLPGQRLFLLMVLFTMLFSGGLVPTYFVVKAVGLINTLWALMIPGMISAFYLIILKNFFHELPEELKESARIDGCHELGILFRIVLPLSLPALAAFGLFYAVGIWNQYFNAVMYISDTSKWPVQVLLRQIVVLSSGGFGDSSQLSGDNVAFYGQTIKMAVVVVSTVPILLVYPFLQKHFAKGVLLGSVKG
jgi:putative aldouronate transport system permease protein